MAWPVVVAWIHYISLMLIIAAILGEHLLLKPDLSLSNAKTIQSLDTIYGASAGLLVLTGVVRMYLEKGVGYYLHSGAFYALLAVFAVVGLISIYPTVVFLRWRGDTRAGRAPQPPPGQLKNLQTILRAEMALLFLAPLFATGMAHGWLSFA
jgi:putative membrane protein